MADQADPHECELLDTPVVRSLRDAAAWAEHCAARLLHDFGAEALSNVHEALHSVTMSTAFSGIGAPETARCSLACCFDAKLTRQSGGDSTSSSGPKNLWACDFDRECRHELRMLRDPPQCVFSDVEGFLNTSVREQIMSFGSRMQWKTLCEIFRQPSVVAVSAPCSKHSRQCQVGRADVHVAGTPCPAWSQQRRNGLPCEMRKDFLHLMIWLAQRRVLQEQAIIHENVEAFPTSLLQEMLGDMYSIESCVVDAAEFGSAAVRRRRWTFLLHKSCVRVHPCSWESWLSSCKRKFESHWEEFMVASEQDVADDFQWMSSRRGSRFGEGDAPGCFEADFLLISNIIVIV